MSIDNEPVIVPSHVGFILDGNRRWARMHSLPEYDGHLAGYNALLDVVEACFEQGVKYVSVYAFSAENWKRDKTEVSSIMQLALRAISKDLKRLVKNNIKMRFLGRSEGISGKLLDALEKAEQKTQHLTGGTFAICFNYGGQQEIVDAVKQCIRDGLLEDQITDESIADRLYAPDLPPVDIVVRTSGEQRISNFMLWRIAYSEFYFMKKYWPDMTKKDVTSIIKEYSSRSRRFGG